jgi:hypothetical protein
MYCRGPQPNPLPSADEAVALENRIAANMNHFYGISMAELNAPQIQGIPVVLCDDDDLEEFEPDEDDEYGDSVPFDVPPLTGGPGTVYG